MIRRPRGAECDLRDMTYRSRYEGRLVDRFHENKRYGVRRSGLPSAPTLTTSRYAEEDSARTIKTIKEGEREGEGGSGLLDDLPIA